MDGSTSGGGVLAGLDVGYGNLKIASYRQGDQHSSSIILPVGAAPASKAAKSMGSGGIDVGEGAVVSIDGEAWVGGVSPLELQDFARPTHANYPKTKEYLALYYTALSKLNTDRVNVLVTGLPVKQFYEGKADGQVVDLQRRLEGSHHISRGRTVTVDRVVVVPQPAGAYTDLVQSDPSLASDRDRFALVLDVGYYSTDWVLIQGGKVADGSSDSSTDATSRVIEKAARQISVANGNLRVSPARVESALRAGREMLAIGDREVDYRAFVAAAANDVGEQVVAKVHSSLRGLADLIDVVALTGGGGELLERPIRAAFSGSKFALSKDPVTANARGFLALARSMSAAPKR